MVLNTDICPTLLEAAGVEIPEGVQGQSFYSILTDSAPGRDAFLYSYFWERPFPQTPTTIGLRTARYKLIRYYGVFDRPELYDIIEDPNETNNLVADYFSLDERETVEARLYSADAPAELRDLFISLNDRLDSELLRLGPLRETAFMDAIPATAQGPREEEGE